MYKVRTERTFSAAHRLAGYKGECERLHGHNWVVQLVVEVEQLDDIGLAIDFKELDAVLDSIVVQLDHCDLNEAPVLGGLNPTSENIARLIHEHVMKVLADRVSGAEVTVWESARHCVTYGHS